MDMLHGRFVLDKNMQLIPSEEALKDTKIVIYYFCATFASNKIIEEKLKQLAEYSEKKSPILSIIYVSFDKYEEDFKNDFLLNQGPWLAIPFQDITATELQYKYSVTCLPRVVVVNKNGDNISFDAANELEQLGLDVLVKWFHYDG